MADGEDWLFRPALAGLMKGESIFDGTLSLAHIAMLNEALTVREENEYRAQKAAERAAQNKQRKR